MWKNLFQRDDDPPRSLSNEGPSVPFVQRMTRELNTLRWQSRAAGARLPIEVLPQIGRVEDILTGLLGHLASNPPSVDEEIAVEGMLTDYLPTSLNTYLNLNPQFAVERRPDGQTPGDDLFEQLCTLEKAARDLSRAIYAHDGQDLQAQGRFLRTKFERSDLAL